MKNLITILCLCSFLFSEELRSEIIKRYDNGNKKIVVKYRGSGFNEEIVERITFSKKNEIIQIHKPLEGINKRFEYYENGHKKVYSNFNNNDKLNGKYIFYYDTGQVQYETNYVDDQINGKYIFYYDTGQVQYETNYVDDQINGKYIFYYDTGQVQYEMNYVDGEINGNYISFYKTGNLKEKGKLKKNKKKGPWLMIDEFGNQTSCFGPFCP